MEAICSVPTQGKVGRGLTSSRGDRRCCWEREGRLFRRCWRRGFVRWRGSNESSGGRGRWRPAVGSLRRWRIASLQLDFADWRKDSPSLLPVADAVVAAASLLTQARERDRVRRRNCFPPVSLPGSVSTAKNPGVAKGRRRADRAAQQPRRGPSFSLLAFARRLNLKFQGERCNGDDGEIG
ncbi:unnamed protein product [Linum trigynum]|uniref:Uncharacterized protein n=1 Tax=Linum trigynum TaxID=586398 RepID=A0AAV2FU56_9ROSI